MRTSGKRHLRTFAVVSAALLFAGCAATPSRVDPFEPFNRAMFSVHEVVDGNVVKPIAEGYVKYVPELLRTGVANFFGNIDDLFIGINNMLEGNGNRAGDDFGRVVLNTTFGLGGIFDLASMMGIEKHNQDFGITFGKWGIEPGPYLFIPLLGPTTVRDGTGTLIRYYLGPITYIVNDVPVRNILYGVGYLNVRAQALETEKLVDTAALDRYRFIRNAYLRARQAQIYEGRPPPEPEDEAQ